MIGIVPFPWKLYDDVGAYIFTWLVGYGSLLAAFAGVMIIDYWVLRKTVLDLAELYRERGRATAGHGRSAAISSAARLRPGSPSLVRSHVSTSSSA